jgi:hypothetical protein
MQIEVCFDHLLGHTDKSCHSDIEHSHVNDEANKGVAHILHGVMGISAAHTEIGRNIDAKPMIEYDQLRCTGRLPVKSL